MGRRDREYALLLLTASTTCKSRGTTTEMLASNWAAQDRSYRGPPVFNAQQIQPQYREIKDVWADKMESMGKMPYPWLDWFVSSTSKATRRKIRSETQDVLVFGEYGSTHDVPGINQQRKARIMMSMSMRRRSGVPNVASGRAGSCVLVQPLLHENSTNDAQFCAFRRCLADCPSGKLGVGKQSHQTQHTFATLENGILSGLIVLKRILSHSSAFNSDQE